MNKNPQQPATRSTGQEHIKVLEQEGLIWKVQIIFRSLEASDREMVQMLRQAKALISSQYQVRTQHLELREVIEKTTHAAGIAVNVSIGRIDLEQGAPSVYLDSEEDDHGNIHDDMIAYADFYCLDENNELISYDKIAELLKEKEVDPDTILRDTLQEAVNKVVTTGRSVEGLVAARGRLPDVGTDASLELAFSVNRADAEGVAEYNQSRKVKKREIICQKNPAKPGLTPGKNVFGIEIPPQKGWDFDLIAGDGAEVSRGGNILSAERAGIAIVEQKDRVISTPAGEKTFPDTVEVSVKSLLSISALDIDDDFVVESSVEINGDMKHGQSVTTRGEIFVSGNLQPGVTLRAAGDISINGQVSGSELTTDNSVFATGDVDSTNITAAKEVEIEGTVSESEISGSEVKIQEAGNSTIIAGYRVELQRVNDQPDGSKTTIKVGRKDMYKQQVEASRKTIKGLLPSLHKIKRIFGTNSVDELRSSTLQKTLMQHMKNLRLNKTSLSEDEVQHLRRLLEAVDPLKIIIAEKTVEIKDLQTRVADESSRKPTVDIREGPNQAVDLVMDDKHAVIQPSKGGVSISLAPLGVIHTNKLAPQEEDPVKAEISAEPETEEKLDDLETETE